MDKLHGVLRTLHGERKSEPARPADHLTVFRDFIAHLERVSRTPPKPRAKARSVRKRAKR